MNAPVDVLAKAMPIPEAGCWLWTGTANERGYGRVYSGGRMWVAHRLSWTQANGPIPSGMFVCHKCDTPACVNPDHLFLGSPRDNVLDMVAKGRHRESKKTHCTKGHELIGDNVRFDGRGQRVCVTCARLRGREWMRTKREKVHGYCH